MGLGQSKEEQLYEAAQRGNHELVKSLRRDGASLEWVDKEGRTPLLLACTLGEGFDMVITLLNLGANINAYRPGANGGFPLHHAAKRGLDKTVDLLLSRGADPLSINDDGQTPLDMARLRGHLCIVRLIEDHICLFSGVLREISGPGFLEVLAPQWITKKIWAVVLPAESSSRRRPPRYELVIYPSSKVPQPRAVISLSKAAMEEPNFSASDPGLVITDRITRARFKLLSEIEGDKQQLERFYKACNGIHQFDGDAIAEPTMKGDSAVTVQFPGPISTVQDSKISEDVALAMAINASLQSASETFQDSTQGASAVNDYKGWIDAPDGTCNGWGAPAPGVNKLGESSNYGGWAGEEHYTHNGWGSSEAGPSTAPSNSPAASMPVPETDLPPAVSGSQVVSAPSITPAAQSAIPPSAPPLPSEYTPSLSSLPSIHYPAIDMSPLELNYDNVNSCKESLPVKEHSDDKAGSVCVVCWDSPAEAVCIPCGHLAGCIGCLSEIQSKKWGCPVCRATIDQVMKVYKV